MATEFRAKFVKQSEKARLLKSETGEHWVPKSITTYYSNDGTGDVKFKVEQWKEEQIAEQGFKYF